MQRSYYLIVILLCSLFGCTKEQSNPDYKSVINQFQINDFYKQCIGHHIIQRRGENQYFYMSDTLVSPIFFASKGSRAVLSNSQLKILSDALQMKSISNPESYIKGIEKKASIIIPFMRENGIYVLSGNQEYISNANILLEIHLENDYILFLVEKDFDKVKATKLGVYEYIDSIDNWLILKKNNERQW